MLNTVISILIFIGMAVFCGIVFILANIDRILKEDANMENIIEVTPDKDGRYFVTLYGNRIELIPVKEQPKQANKPAKTDK